MLSSRFITQEQLGFRKTQVRTTAVIISAAVGGLAIFLLQNPPSTHPLVVFNIYTQVLPVSIAEVVVCWAVIGTSFGSLAKRKVSNNNKAISIVIGAIVASVLFGVYHFAHSPPI
jgi:hypothetical protein